MTQQIFKVGVLFARNDSRYKDFDIYDVYDINRDARQYSENYPVLCHPPCRAWGMLSHMANPRPDEKDLAWFALEKVRQLGGYWNTQKEVGYGKRLNYLRWDKVMILMADLHYLLTNLILVMLRIKIQSSTFAA